MCSISALQSLMRPPLLLLHSTKSNSQTPLHSSRKLAAAVTAMTGPDSPGCCSSSEHVAGAWFSVPDLRLRDHYFTVLLDYSLNSTTGPKITIFAREVVSVGKEEQPLPFLLYVQGGPGFESPRPTEGSGRISKACEECRLVLLDQRGTGLSTPLTTSSMMQINSPGGLINYLKHFCADNIVNDAEFIRVHLVPDAGTWTILGQSYGGLWVVTYLSFAPKGLKQVLITGGIPRSETGFTADSVYSACFEQYERSLDFDTNPLYALLHESICCRGAPHAVLGIESGPKKRESLMQ